ncbi:hypothetical protein B0H15DRAFT_72567 [Mycena belliarum]|uniref:G-patch domain-containing protein n=1 Tax=Mycena belliarum TaxID=1033014 RepID=A0AAD6UCX3_9AGAR|nr:hypothetical protein B0H15DRAFT_72567 [Mycena belliae]
MATTSYTIYSRYDPAQRERLERETGQIPSDTQDTDSAEAWEAEATLTFKRKLAPPPRFVPAAGDSLPSVPKEIPRPPSSDIAGWYRSLTHSPRATAPSESENSSPQSRLRNPERGNLERRTKNNWFIMKAIKSEPAPAVAPLPSLADILARDPPPLPHEAQYQPPVWLAIGPANKGFKMLQNSGWSEGEALGPDIVRRPTARRDIAPEEMIGPSNGYEARLIKKEVLHMPVRAQDGEQEIIDLTMSDTEFSEESDAEDNTPASTNIQAEGSRKALITPIATVLKSDRLGIGLKAKTVGPYKASQKRITHNAAAMLAHTKTAEELKKMKKQHGRGHRGFSRRGKFEEANRKTLLAYMNQG